MRVLGLNITRASNRDDSELVSRPANGQGMWSQVFNHLQPRVVAPGLYEALREAIPVLDAAIDRTVTVDGTPVIVGDDEKLVSEISTWAENVTVNDIQKGLPTFSASLRNEAHEQGCAIGEFVSNSRGNDIERLRVADSKGIAFSRGKDNELQWWYNPATPLRHRIHNTGKESVQALLEDRASANVAGSVLTGGANSYTRLNPINKVYLAYRTENADPYGVSMFRSMPFVAKILLTIQNSIGNTFERFGDPSYHVSYKAAGRVNSTELEARRTTIAKEFLKAITAKRTGQSGDFITAVDKDSDMKVEIIGANGETIDVEMPARHVLEQIVAKSGLPAWMLGLHFSTAERLARFQSEMLKQESDTRTEFERLELERVVAAMLRLRGRAWSDDTVEIERNGHKQRVRKAWRVEFIKPNLSDMEAQARANFMNAQAESVRAGNGSQAMTVESTSPDGAKNSLHFDGQDARMPRALGCVRAAHPVFRPVNLETRPIDNPAMDQIEKDALAGLMDDWDESTDYIIRALGLESVDQHDVQVAQVSRSQETGATNGMTPEGFTLTEKDKELIADEMAVFILASVDNGALNQGPLAKAYIRAWAQGVLDAATRSGLESPIGELSNDAAVTRLLQTSQQEFETFIDNKLTQRIYRVLEAGVDAGENPINIAANLRREMGGARWKWEQIARSETAMAWDDAKRSEWDSEIADGLIEDLFDFVPAPDGCPQCQSKAANNPQPLNKTPKPVVNTHPSCRCDVMPHIEE